ncbi:uncharacterized protein LOC100680235 isoform X2 [Nasonia vitripennis]|uniref:RING-type domain-containing protein n=1 Tax=Nasonia vitripennis TaxID=7425 RepID=A0A7M7GDZ6_NASVI|nr:uncharacterized protein LOC100680235 isoform X2 [Nasonia vitripennis]
MHNNKSFKSATMDEVEKKAHYEKKIKAASLAFLEEKNYAKASHDYNEALKIANELHFGAMKECILRFMICHCKVLESNKLEDLAEVVMTLQTINKTLKERFPAIYCLLAYTHCKLYRFDHALESLRAANDIFKRNQLLEIFYIPGTTTPIEQNPKGKMWSIVEKECAIYHKPDAICASKECNQITKPYVSPNKNIYVKDPAFNGMVIVHCNNKERGCILKFHPSCWKVIKDETNLVQKVLDKDMLGVQCFTPNCMYENNICRISLIEVLGPNGEVKAQMKKTTNDSWPVNKNVSKGAIKKQKAVCTTTTESPKFTPRKEHVPVIPTTEFRDQKKLNRYDDFCDENRLVTVTIGSANFDATDNSPEAGERAFLFSLFYHYIRDNLVRVCDLYNKFYELRESLVYFKDIDILSFLLDTNVISLMDNKDVGDMLDDLMNDGYIDGYFNDATGNRKSNNNNIPDVQCLSNGRNGNCKEDEEAAGGDELSRYPENNSIDVNKKITEYNELQDYVASLKREIRNLAEETSQLKKEAQEKDYKIEVFLKQMNECEALYEEMSDFRVRYDEIKDENFNLKKEIITFVNDKKLLEEQIAKLNDSEVRRNEIKQTFETEYKILQDCINSSWEKKTKELNASLKQELEAKKSLLSRYLQTQFDAYTNLLNEYINQCTIELEVIGKLNGWMEKYMNVKSFKDNTKWMNRLIYLQKASDDLQKNFTNLFGKLDTEECPDEVCLECPSVPDALKENLSDIVMNALNAYYISQYEFVKNLMQKQQQQQQQINQQWQTQQLQAQQLQRSAAYMHAYQYNAFQQHALPFASTIAPHPAYPVGRQILNQQFYSQPPIVQNGTSIPDQKTNVEIKELSSSSSENSSVKSATSLLGKLDIQNKKEELKAETTAPVKTDLKEETKTKRKESKDIFDKISEKQEQMRKALKAIALNVREKADTEPVQDEQSNTYMNGDSNEVEKKIEADDNGLHLEIDDDNKSDLTSVTSKGNSPKLKKKAGINSLIKVMQQRYPGALEVDIVEIIAEIRKKNNGTLTGKPVNEILIESEEYFSRNQRIRSAQKTPHRDWISPSISEKFMNGTDTRSVQKKAWNIIIPQEEAKWTGSGEIECSICMNYVQKQKCYALTCRHSFHIECIKKWLKSDRSCPNCRVVVTEDDEFPPLPA